MSTVSVRERATVMVSGGLDSTVLTAWADYKGYEVWPLFVDYGQHGAETELASIKALNKPDILERLEIVDLRSVFGGSASRIIEETDLWTEQIVADDCTYPTATLCSSQRGPPHLPESALQFYSPASSVATKPGKSMCQLHS